MTIQILNTKQKLWNENIDKISKVREALISELAELIWETENIKKSAEKYGIPFSQIEKDIEILKNIFYEENVFIPLQVCFIPYKREIGKDYYIQYRRMLIDKLKGNPSLIEKFNPIYFRDRVLAKARILKRGWALKYLEYDTRMLKIMVMNKLEKRWNSNSICISKISAGQRMGEVCNCEF